MKWCGGERVKRRKPGPAPLLSVPAFVPGCGFLFTQIIQAGDFRSPDPMTVLKIVKGENILGNLTPLTDFCLKCSMKEQKVENQISGSSAPSILRIVISLKRETRIVFIFPISRL